MIRRGTHRHLREPHATTASPRPCSCPSTPSGRPTTGSPHPTPSYHAAAIGCPSRARTSPTSLGAWASGAAWRVGVASLALGAARVGLRAKIRLGGRRAQIQGAVRRRGRLLGDMLRARDWVWIENQGMDERFMERTRSSPCPPRLCL